jgi:hypothetical protein
MTATTTANRSSDEQTRTFWVCHELSLRAGQGAAEIAGCLRDDMYWASHLFFARAVRTTLNRLEREGKVCHEGNLWSLTPAGLAAERRLG